MDFRRIELIFIAIFIALDIYLFVSLREDQTVDSTNSNGASLTSQVMKDLKDDNITVKKLSNQHADGYYLASRKVDQTKLQAASTELTDQEITYNQNRHSLSSNLQTVLPFKKGEAVSVTTNFMKSSHHIAFGSHYVYSPELSTSQQVVYVQKVPSGIMMDDDGQIVFKITKGQIVSYTQTYVAKALILREKENTKISAREAVITLYTDNEIPNNSKISWVKLGYTPLLNAKGSTVYIPAWQVAIENKNSKNTVIKRVNAFTGVLMKNQSTTSSD